GVGSGRGRVRVLRAADGASKPRQNTVFATGLDQPFGLAFYPPGPDPQWVYVANTNSVVRFPYRAGDLKARARPETIVRALPTGGHFTRTLAFSKDGRQMFVSVGSAGNAGADMRQRGAPQIARWAAAHAPRAAPDTPTPP